MGYIRRNAVEHGTRELSGTVHDVCNMYSSLESEMDAGYTLLIILQSDEDNSVTIDSAETAALVSSILTDSLGN